MENTQRFNPNPVSLKVKELRRESLNPHPDTKSYYTPLWLQEVLQELRAENKQKTVVC
jgi:hypothetical protein